MKKKLKEKRFQTLIMIKSALYINKMMVVSKENGYVSKVRCEKCTKINKTKQYLINQTSPSGTKDLI